MRHTLTQTIFIQVLVFPEAHPGIKSKEKPVKDKEMVKYLKNYCIKIARLTFLHPQSVHDTPFVDTPSWSSSTPQIEPSPAQPLTHWNLKRNGCLHTNRIHTY